MTSHFSPRSLAFYGLAIVSVTLLFSFVSAYGEANLKAPQRIDGSYQITAEGLPDCLSSQPLSLLIQQSGIYVAGSLLPTNASDQTLKAAEKRPLLNGHWRDHQLTFQGRVDLSPNCRHDVTIQATASPAQTTAKTTLNGTLQFSPEGTPARFTAVQQAGQENGSGSHTKPE